MSTPVVSPLARGTLGRRLVVRVVAIIAAVCLVIGLATLVATNQVLVSQLDAQLDIVQVREPRSDPGRDREGRPPGQDEVGNPIGTLKLEVRNGRPVATLLTEDGLTTPPSSVVDDLLAVPRDGKPHSIVLDGLGPYRAVVTQRGPTLQVTGLPLGSVTHVLGRLALAELALVAAALLTAVLVTRRVVASSLRPLNRVAATAHAVSRQDLGRGEVTVGARVADEDADPTTEVGQVGQALNHLIDNVEHALAARQRSETRVRQFVADASHELRNPLASIRGYAELTQRQRDQLPTQAGVAIDRIEAESVRMSDLVDDLLLLARLDDDQGVAAEPVDVVESVLQAVQDARVAGPGHRWLVQVPDEPAIAMADPRRLPQVVGNLLSNARKHTPEGTRVTTSVGREAGYVVVEVADDGPGIPDKVSGQVFERFARADSARAHSTESSTGLGLAIVHAVMEAHGGWARVDSAPGRTRFTVGFPAVDEP